MASVREFYERFPYPHKTDDRPSSPGILPSSFDAVRHHCWGGRWPARRTFRALVAGGGTGDAVVSLGLSLMRRGVDWEIHYIDLSAPSAAIARRRAEKAGLDRVTFSVGPIEDVTGEFDYIDLSGVLPVLPDPETTLTHLASLLAPDGAMGVMSYGRIGRTGVESFRRMHGVLSGDTDVAFARELMRTLPARNWINRNEKLGRDVSQISDTEFADRFMAPHEFAYSVSELAAMFERTGLPIRSFIPGLLYDPARILKSADIRQRLASLSYLVRAQIAEDAQGDINKHVFYATKQPKAPVEVADFLGVGNAIALPRNMDCASLSKALAGGKDAVSIGFLVDGVERAVAIRCDQNAARFVAALADEPTIADLRRDIPDETIQYMSAVLVSIEALHFAIQ